MKSTSEDLTLLGAHLYFLVPTRQTSQHAALLSGLGLSCLSSQTGVILGQGTFYLPNVPYPDE